MNLRKRFEERWEEEKKKKWRKDGWNGDYSPSKNIQKSTIKTGIFGVLGTLSIIGFFVSIVYLIVTMSLSFNWVLLYSGILNLISAIAWFTVSSNFEHLARTRKFERSE